MGRAAHTVRQRTQPARRAHLTYTNEHSHTHTRTHARTHACVLDLVYLETPSITDKSGSSRRVSGTHHCLLRGCSSAAGHVSLQGSPLRDGALPAQLWLQRRSGHQQ